MALALDAVGESSIALGYYETMNNIEFDQFAFVRAHERARLLEKLGGGSEAIAENEKFIAGWSECDPELRPRVEEARKRVAALRGDARAQRARSGATSSSTRASATARTLGASG
jgi:hypothetical protein